MPDVYIKPYIEVSHRIMSHKRGRTVGPSLERLEEVSVLSVKEELLSLFSFFKPQKMGPKPTVN
jgi:hypothetical protein